MKQTFTEWYLENHKYGDLCPPPMTNEEFENFLVKYLLDDNFCVRPDDVSHEDLQRLDELGFFPYEDYGFISYRYGSN